MSTWLFDLGNTRLKCAELRDGKAGPVHALPYATGSMGTLLAGILPMHLDIAHVASVATASRRVDLLEALTRHCGRIELARTQARFDGLRIAYADPARLGVDRFLAMLGARRQVQGAVLVCSVGTAITLDLVDAEGIHRGGRIAPSPALMREALHARAPQLPAEGGAWVDWALDTDDALASGCQSAALALIDEAHASARRCLDGEVRLLLHGGGVEPVVARRPDALHVPALVLDGLAAWASSG
ncbi:MAG: type III pantothenate kinase [Lysobacter sp.]|nr:MAG: type III pantothenate kinase [Lysobacter sp.]